jgi:hypothetical protein
MEDFLFSQHLADFLCNNVSLGAKGTSGVSSFGLFNCFTVLLSDAYYIGFY